jgi:hypothetical protein
VAGDYMQCVRCESSSRDVVAGTNWSRRRNLLDWVSQICPGVAKPRNLLLPKLSLTPRGNQLPKDGVRWVSARGGSTRTWCRHTGHARRTRSHRLAFFCLLPRTRIVRRTPHAHAQIHARGYACMRADIVAVRYFADCGGPCISQSASTLCPICRRSAHLIR